MPLGGVCIYCFRWSLECEYFNSAPIKGFKILEAVEFVQMNIPDKKKINEGRLHRIILRNNWFL